jgi:hypothetical protein
MKKLKVSVVGIKPLMIHKFNIESVSAMAKVKSGSAGNDPEEWKTSFFEKVGQLYLPANYWFSCFKAASVYTKVGRGTIQKNFVAGVIILDEMTLLNRHVPKNWQEITFQEFGVDSNKPVYIDVRGVMNPNSKGRNVRYRVCCSPGWETQINLSFDETILSLAQIKKILDDAGKLIGMADGRTLGYGRFSIKNVENI